MDAKAVQRLGFKNLDELMLKSTFRGYANSMTSVLAVVTLAVALQSDQWPSSPVQLHGALDVRGAPFTPDIRNHKANVLFFIAVECPIANRYAPEIRRIEAHYRAKGVRFYRVYMEPVSRAAEVTRHGVEYGLTFKALLDPEKALVRAVGARVTPEAAVIGPDGTLLYRGRIDDQNIEHGKIRPNYRRDLRIALDEILAKRQVSMRSTAATGCFIGSN